MGKKLTKIMWYGAETDANGNPVVPPISPSVERHLEGLNEGEIYIHNDDTNPAIFIRTNRGNIVAIGGGDIETLTKIFLRKDQDDRSKGKIASDVALEVGKFVTGASGAIIQVDKATGQTVAELDKLYVRMKAYFETLEIINVNSVGGRMILSPAGSVTCIGVEETDDAYRCYFLGEQDGEVIENRFESGDQAYSEMFNAKEGVSNKVSNHYYWRLVTFATENVVDYNNQKCHYIELSKTDCDADSDVPKAGDVICHRGSRTDTDRMNFIEFSSVGVNAPYITLFQGVGGTTPYYSLTNKEYVSYGYDQSTGRAYMNVYGDMYVGDRNQTSYIRYTPENGLEIKGKLSVGTTLGGKDLQEMIDSASPEGYQEFVDAVTGDLANIKTEVGGIETNILDLQKQIDGAIDSYFLEIDPTLTNYPANEWTTDKLKEAHLGDTYTNNESGDSWRWGKDSSGKYAWIYIEDTATKKALAAASSAQAAADGKMKVFITTPKLTDAYDVGDLWVNATYGQYKNDILRCNTAKAAGVSFSINHWGYASNYANKESVNQISVSVDTLASGLNELGTNLDAVKQQVDKEYTIWFFDYTPTLNNYPASEWTTTELKDAHDQDMFYYREEGLAWRFENGKWNQIKDQDILRALEQIKALQEAQEDFDYLQDAFSKDETVVVGGMTMGSFVGVRNSSNEVEACINGSDFAKDSTHGKLLLAGGIPTGSGTIEERIKDACTRIYEDGTMVTGTVNLRTLQGGGSMDGYSFAVGEGTYTLPSPTGFMQVYAYCHWYTRTARIFHIQTAGNTKILLPSEDNEAVGYEVVSSFNPKDNIIYKFTSIPDATYGWVWVVSQEKIMTYNDYYGLS